MNISDELRRVRAAYEAMNGAEREDQGERVSPSTVPAAPLWRRDTDGAGEASPSPAISAAGGEEAPPVQAYSLTRPPEQAETPSIRWTAEAFAPEPIPVGEDAPPTGAEQERLLDTLRERLDREARLYPQSLDEEERL